jgi:hypothetical protein
MTVMLKYALTSQRKAHQLVYNTTNDNDYAEQFLYFYNFTINAGNA